MPGFDFQEIETQCKQRIQELLDQYLEGGRHYGENLHDIFQLFQPFIGTMATTIILWCAFTWMVITIEDGSRRDLTEDEMSQIGLVKVWLYTQWAHHVHDEAIASQIGCQLCGKAGCYMSRVIRLLCNAIHAHWSHQDVESDHLYEQCRSVLPYRYRHHIDVLKALSF